MARRAGRAPASAETVTPTHREDLPPFRPADYVPRPAGGWTPAAVWEAAHLWAAEHDTKAVYAWHAFAYERRPGAAYVADGSDRVRPGLVRAELRDRLRPEPEPEPQTERERFGF
ncbi:hypothetical protein ACWEDF_13250 [Micromonospora chersina]